MRGSELDPRAPTCHIAMSAPQKRPRGDDAADESTEGVAVVASMSISQASSSQGIHLVNGVAVSMSFAYTTMYQPPAVLYLLANGQVAFQSSGDVPACCSHGTSTLSPDQQTLRVWFHYAGNWGRIREHVYQRLTHTDSFELQVTHAEYRAFLIKRTDQ